jgi:hypothetical protein
VSKIIINLGVAAFEQSNVVGERFSADDSILNIEELKARAHFSKRQLLESHLHIADYGVASLDDI